MKTKRETTDLGLAAMAVVARVGEQRSVFLPSDRANEVTTAGRTTAAEAESALIRESPGAVEGDRGKSGRKRPCGPVDASAGADANEVPGCFPAAGQAVAMIDGSATGDPVVDQEVG